MLYYKRHWNEDRGDEHSDWGESDWYFEVGQDGYALRQMEVYQSGMVLKYHADYDEDEYGRLSNIVLDPQEYEPYRISADQFEDEWRSARELNQAAV